VWRKRVRIDRTARVACPDDAGTANQRLSVSQTVPTGSKPLSPATFSAHDDLDLVSHLDAGAYLEQIVRVCCHGPGDRAVHKERCQISQEVTLGFACERANRRTECDRSRLLCRTLCHRRSDSRGASSKSPIASTSCSLTAKAHGSTIAYGEGPTIVEQGRVRTASGIGGKPGGQCTMCKRQHMRWTPRGAHCCPRCDAR